MDSDKLISETKQSMEKALDHFREDLAVVRIGRANPSLLEGLKVDAYGTKMNLRELASINSPQPALLVVQVWDSGNVTDVEKALRESPLNLIPSTEGNLIKVPIPPLSEERRAEMKKLVVEKAENARVSVRNKRRETIERVEKAEKNKEMSEDEKFKLSRQVQKITEDFSKQIDNLAKQKESEILNI